MKKKIRFIANPFSGTGSKLKLPQLIETHLDLNQFEYDLSYTKFAGHAIDLAKEAVEQNYYMVVACGGDGSINEVAKSLIGTKTILGILPYGSGNGFAMHLKIGRNVEKAIQFLNNGKILMIDSCLFNETPFVNLSGVGFDANVAARIKGSKLRGFWGYLKYGILEAFGYQMQDFEIEIDGKKLYRKCFTVEVANAPMYGYGFVVAPSAKLNDGILEVMILKAAPKWKIILEGWRFLTNSLNNSFLAERFEAKKVKIFSKNKPLAVHYDGESGYSETGVLEYSIVPNSLKVMCPKEYLV